MSYYSMKPEATSVGGFVWGPFFFWQLVHEAGGKLVITSCNFSAQVLSSLALLLQKYKYWHLRSFFFLHGRSCGRLLRLAPAGRASVDSATQVPSLLALLVQNWYKSTNTDAWGAACQACRLVEVRARSSLHKPSFDSLDNTWYWSTKEENTRNFYHRDPDCRRLHEPSLPHY